MPNAAKARIFRSTRTAPNVLPAADLTTAFGAAANTTTTAPFAAGQSAYRFNPSAAGTAGESPPAAPSTATGNAWRDTTPEHATFLVRYAAGTWTVRTRINKTVMTVNASVTVRVTVIVYQVSTSGTHIAEIGRVQLADTALPTVNAAVTVTGSFTTGAATNFAAGDKVQVECYVQNIIAGNPGAALAAYTVAFVVDETSANSGASFTAIPNYTLFAETTGTATGLGTATGVLGATGAMAGTTTGLGTATGLTSAVAGTTGTATGSSIATGVFTAIGAMTGTSTGSGNAAGVLGAIGGMVGSAAGSGVAIGVLGATSGMVGTAIGSGTAAAQASSVAGSVGTASGLGTATGLASIVLGTIGTGGLGDRPLNNPTKAVAGTVRNSSGGPVAGATVKLFRQFDDNLISTTISAADGSYSFPRDETDTQTYYVLAYETDGVETHGVTDRGLVPSA